MKIETTNGAVFDYDPVSLGAQDDLAELFRETREAVARMISIRDGMQDDASFFYLATPFSKYEYGLDAAWNAAVGLTNWLMKLDINIYSPIVHAWPVAKTGGLPQTLDHWLKIDMPYMRASHGLIVGELPGWESSEGIDAEIEYYEANGKPIIYLPIMMLQETSQPILREETLLDVLLRQRKGGTQN